MTRNEARDYINHNPDGFLEHDKYTGYVCPICGAGSGKHGTGINLYKNDPYHFTCWSGNCFQCKDVLDIIGLKYGISNYNGKLRKACEIYGINYTNLDYEGKTGDKAPSLLRVEAPTERKASTALTEKDYTDFFRKCRGNLDKCDYLQRRGISKATSLFFFLGYVWHDDHYKLVVPTSRSSYFCRDTRPDNEIPEDQRAWKKFKKGSIHFFNINRALRSNQPIFIVEGEIDALSILEIGYQAVAIGTTKKVKDFVEYIKDRRPTQELLITFDNDNAGQIATKELDEGLNEIGISHRIVNICGGYKDPNDFLVADREGFTQAVRNALPNVQLPSQE